MGEQIQKGQDHPSDFVELVKAVVRMDTNLQHMAKEQDKMSGQMQQYTIEHRSQHLEERTLRKEEIDEAARKLEESVARRLHERADRWKIYVGLGTLGVGAVITDVIVRLLGS